MRKSIKEMMEEILLCFSISNGKDRKYLQKLIDALPFGQLKESLVNVMRASEHIKFEEIHLYEDFNQILIQAFRAGFLGESKFITLVTLKKTILFLELQVSNKIYIKNVKSLVEAFHETGFQTKLIMDSIFVLTEHYMNLDTAPQVSLNY